MATSKKSAAKGGSQAETAASSRYPGIGRSAITGRVMSVAAAKAHKKTAMVQGAGRRRAD